MKTKETKAYILSRDGNYLILPNLTLVQKGYETPRGLCDSVWFTTEPINLEEAWETIDQQIQRLVKYEYNHYGYINDDDSDDDLPDLFNQYLQLAYQKSLEDYQKAWKQITENFFIREGYTQDLLEGPIQAFLDTPEEIREALHPFINL